jgi:hypothetical protein
VTDEVWATVAQNKRQSKVDLASITGTYQDKWFGDVISEKKGNYFFYSKRSSQLSGEVFSIEGNYVVKWNNAYLHDAHLFYV